MKTTPWIRHKAWLSPDGVTFFCRLCKIPVPDPGPETTVCQKDDRWLIGDEPNAKDCR